MLHGDIYAKVSMPVQKDVAPGRDRRKQVEKKKVSGENRGESERTAARGVTLFRSRTTIPPTFTHPLRLNDFFVYPRVISHGDTRQKSVRFDFLRKRKRKKNEDRERESERERERERITLVNDDGYVVNPWGMLRANEERSDDKSEWICMLIKYHLVAFLVAKVWCAATCAIGSFDFATRARLFSRKDAFVEEPRAPRQSKPPRDEHRKGQEGQWARDSEGGGRG